MDVRYLILPLTVDATACPCLTIVYRVPTSKVFGYTATMILQLIAHRGGVVDSIEDENTIGSLSAAVHERYYGVEIDIRETADHVAVLHHEARINRKSIDSMSHRELTDHCDQTGISTPPELGEALEVCRGKMKIMIEIKVSSPSKRFLESVEDSLTQNQLWDDLLVIGTAAGKEHFSGRALVSMRLKEFKRMREISPSTAKNRFLFDHGNRLRRLDVERAILAGMLVVPSINIFHYKRKTNPDDDFRMLIDAGANRFQIDSAYRSCIESINRSG